MNSARPSSQVLADASSPPGGGLRLCAWPPCRAPLRPGARPDAIYHSKPCRQAAWRLREQLGTAERADRPLRLAYADPPYPGLSKKYYNGHPDFAGEVDHTALLSRLQAYDGWALSTSTDALPEILALCVVQDLQVRVGAWIRGSRPTAARGPLSAWEPVVYRGARPLVSSEPGDDVLILDDVLIFAAKPRRSDPKHVIGAKPWPFCAWLFRDLLQARAGDQLDDLFPGSGGVQIAWEAWTSPPPARDASPPSPGDAPQEYCGDVSDGAGADTLASLSAVCDATARAA